MKKFLLFFLGVLLATVALTVANDALNRYLIFSSSNANPYKMYRLLTAPEADEIPILGSSRAEAGFAPAELSATAFNYGLSGSSMRETAFHLKVALARPGGGRVIVNLDPWGLGNGAFQGDYRFVADAPLGRAESRIKVPPLDRIVGIRFQGATRKNLAECVNNRLAVTKTMERGAILQRISRSAEEWDYIIARCTPAAFGRDAETERLLAEILSANRDKEIVFVVSPISAPWWARFNGKEDLAELERWLEGFPQCRVFDAQKELPQYELSEFMDLTHLNEHGARRFTRELRAALAQ